MAHNISKRMKALRENDLSKPYIAETALELLKSVSNVKFVESVDAAFILGINAKNSEQMVRGATVLPHGSGRHVRVAVFAQGPAAEAAKQAGAEIVGFADLAETLKQQTDRGEKLEFDVLIATPDAMRVIAPLARVLGPRGLMPNPKVGTLTMNVGEAVKAAKSGQIAFRTDKGGIVHCTIGKVDFKVTALKENLEQVIAELKRLKPSTSKGVYLKKIVLSTTMGPGLTLDLGSLNI